jgi:hypothetical protein
VFFHTDITVDWNVHDANGGIVSPDANGVLSVSADQDYEIRAHIEDKNGASGPASLQNLPAEAEFTMIRRDRAGRPVREKMQVDKAASRAVARLRYPDGDGEDEVAVSITMPGFVTARSRAIKIKVVRTNIDVRMTAKPILQCPACSASKVEPQITPSTPWTPVMGVAATFDARGGQVRSGKAAFALADPLPAGLRARIAGRNEVLEGARTSVELPFESTGHI